MHWLVQSISKENLRLTINGITNTTIKGQNTEAHKIKTSIYFSIHYGAMGEPHQRKYQICCFHGDKNTDWSLLGHDTV
jgi:hypothetical protein